MTARGLHTAIKYRPEIDGLRAVAVTAVIANHFNSSLLPGGFLGVDIFFVISGYVITASLMMDKSERFKEFLLRFYARRIKRLLPALIVCIVVTALVGAIFINSHTAAFKSSMRAGLYALVGLSNMDFFSHAADYFASSTGLNLFTHTWSLGVEEQFYVVYPTLFWLGLRCRAALAWRAEVSVALLGLLVVASWVSYVWMHRVGFPGTYFLMPPRFWELGLGCATYLCGDRLAGINAGTLRVWAATIGVATALTLGPTWQVISTSVVVVATAVLILSLRPGHAIYRLLTLKPVLSMGLMSYSLYLWHWSVMVLGRWTIGVDWKTAPFELGLIVALSVATYSIVERPLRQAQWAPQQLVTISYGAIGVFCAAAFVQALIHPLSSMFYVGEPARLVQNGVASLLNDRWSSGRLIWPARECVLESDHDVGKAILHDRCTFGAEGSGRRHFLVIGNSFSAAEFEMYSVLAERGLGAVTATSSWGASPVPEIPNRSPWSGANDYYWGTVVPALSDSLRAGDVLVMIDELTATIPDPALAGGEADNNLQRLETGLSRLSQNMQRRGIVVIFQTANPFMRDAQCTPDMAKRQWFNVGEQQLCSYHTQEATLARRKPLDDTLRRVQARNANFHILDLMPVMCAGDLCMMTNDKGIMLYRDEWSHPSVEANQLAQGSLLSVVNGAVSAAQSAIGGTP